METIFSASVVYISTSIDYLFILLILFSQKKVQHQKAQVVWGHYLGTTLLVSVSLLAAYVLHFVPEEWMIGFLGFIPIYLGVQFAIKGEEETEEEEVVEKMNASPTSYLFWTVTLLTIASGGDNLGIYIPYFASLAVREIVIALLVFAVSIPLLCYVSNLLTKLPLVSETIEKYERIIVPIVFIGLGIYILIENHTLQTLFTLIQ
ncbi:CadD family cadmium resistance transporter [Lacticigenium naphthae]|uniref:CadD family cadmium resistance transporter n=1 Tax=Lacticigenium naphthae TaxID=515351 RepID=UPI00040740B5|nr:CadD family cadmium resistance transporter [Lacticigenium naphthae]